jgi:acyl transferase domain-containing protein
MPNDSGQVAIIGMSGRFPGAPDLERFWTNLVSGVESISFFSEEQLLDSGLSAEQIRKGNIIPAKGVLDGACEFDAAAFDFSTRDACLMDPQFRVFLETALAALDEAGCSGDDNQRTGVFAGAGANTYQEFLKAESDLLGQVSLSQAAVLNQVDFLSSWVSYKLNLTGPSVTVQSACSTSLAAVHLAVQSLLNGECDVAIAGGVSLSFPQRTGYVYVEGGLFSRDGHCRAFDARANGFVPGEGVGVLVLKRLSSAVAAGDTIRAIIKGTALNNDGSNKIGFTAPSQRGMAAAALEAVTIAGVSCESIRMVEAHGTATTLGDPLEVAALTQAFRRQTPKKQFCAIGSVKSNIGHANAAAGIAGVIKATLAIEKGIIPPSLHCEEPNPLIGFEQTPFYVNSKPESWPEDGLPRRAAVNSFGIGGTNVHLILEQAPPREPSGPSRSDQLILLSAKTQSALEMTAARLADYLESAPSSSLPDVSYTLATGRRALEHRMAILCEGSVDLIRALRGGNPDRVVARYDDSQARKLTFLFPPHAGLYGNATAGLYSDEYAFRDAMDRCAETLLRLHGEDIRTTLYHGVDAQSTGALRDDARLARAITVAVQYSLAKLLDSWGLSPDASFGCGAGELASSCVANTLTLEYALWSALAETDGGTEFHDLRITRPHALRVSERSTQSEAFVSANERRFGEALDSIRESPEQAVIILSEEPPVKLFGLQDAAQDVVAISALRPAEDFMSDRQWLLKGLGQLWTASVAVDWQTYYSTEKRHHIPLPSYPFERRLYWVDSTKAISAQPAGNGTATVFKPKRREPQNDLQAVVASIWAFYLGVEKVGIDESFFDLGGNSILATRIVTALRDTLQVDLPLRVLLENPTVLSMSEALEKNAREWEIDIHEIARIVRDIQQMPTEGAAQRLAHDGNGAPFSERPGA